MHSSKEHYNINMTLTLTITYSIYLIQLMLIDIEYLEVVYISTVKTVLNLLYYSRIFNINAKTIILNL